MSKFKLLFSNYFNIDEKLLDYYGALNICLSSDLPLFVDPFLLFASEKEEYLKTLEHDIYRLEVITLSLEDILNDYLHKEKKCLEFVKTILKVN